MKGPMEGEGPYVPPVDPLRSPTARFANCLVGTTPGPYVCCWPYPCGDWPCPRAPAEGLEKLVRPELEESVRLDLAEDRSSVCERGALGGWECWMDGRRAKELIWPP